MTIAPSHRAPRSWPVVVAAVIGILLLVGLGSWQMLRLQWKLDLIEKREGSLTGNPVTIYDIEAGMEHGYDVDFLRVRLNGKYRHEASRYVYRARGKRPGFQVITPFIDKSGFIVFVDRGFIDQRMLKVPIAGDTRKPEGELTLTGVTRNRASDRNMFSPEADTEKSIWYWYDLVGISASMPKNLLDGYQGPEPITSAMFVQLEPGGEPGAGTWPDPEDLKVELPNNHLQYAFTWYALALVLAAMSWLFIRNRRRDHGTGEA
ncbi:MAG: SURF1 family cytochrome oxidase biogenesis protein [Anderseniella sp.]